MFSIDYVYNDIFRKIRLELGYTQKEFAEVLHCTQAQVSRIENNERPVSNEILMDLSNLYKIDLKNNLSVLANFKNFEVYQKYSKLLMYQNLNNYDLLKELEEELKDPIIEEEFNTGELYLLKNLSYAIVECYLYHNFEKAIEYCLKNLDSTEEELYSHKPTTMKSPFYYSSATVYVTSAFMLGKVELAAAVCGNIFDHYNTVWKEDVFSLATMDIFYRMQQLFFYIIYAFILFKSGEYAQSLEICNYTLIKCKDLNVVNMIGFILFVKFQTLYKLGDIEGSKLALMDLSVITKYCELPSVTYRFTGYNEDDYPELFGK